MAERIFDRPGPEMGIWFQVWADTFLTQLEEVPAIQEALGSVADDLVAVEAATEAAQDAADLAIAAAASADEAADEAQAETSIVNSFPTNYTAPLIEADAAGDVTIANHDRQYGNTFVNPTAAVTGDTIASGEVNPAVVRIYYDDASRAGGAVTYLFTVDPADAPVQGGDRHVVGAVTIPAAGTQSGGVVRPPGYVEP